MATDQVSGHNPTWSRDELILALDLYHTTRGNPLRSGSEVEQLSSLLNQIGRKPNSSHDFRNPNGVYMKVMNFRRFDPHYIATGAIGLTRGSKDEEVVWHLFSNSPARLKAAAEAIRANAGQPRPL